MQDTIILKYTTVFINITEKADDWQTAVLQVMWFENACVVSDGIKCYPTSTATNNYNNWGPINDLQVILQLPNNRAILSAYQLSTEMSSPSHLVTALDVNEFYQQFTPCIQGNEYILSLQGAYAGQYVKGYIILMFSTDLLQHSPSLTANMITKTIKTCML